MEILQKHYIFTKATNITSSQKLAICLRNFNFAITFIQMHLLIKILCNQNKQFAFYGEYIYVKSLFSNPGFSSSDFKYMKHTLNIQIDQKRHYLISLT